MKSYPRNLEFAEFIRIFRDRYAYEGGNGLTLIAMTTDQALLLSKYLFRGIVDWTPPAIGTDGLSDLGASLERFAERNIREMNLELKVSEEDLRALGVFLMRGLVAVFLTLESSHERVYCC